ncbi:hypothetical protein [Phenylobacterium immobile]|uniref:hypothetical protein n=1 Tax=Phenylobacterium immobile TaxID=21 RepID=UPI000A981029|nr:hypothetical protein [Phenylobacterium immobile]
MLVFEDDELIVRSSDNLSGDTCVVTFSHREKYPYADGKAGFSEGFLQKRGIPHVCFIAKRNHWWQVRSLPYAMSAAWAAIAGKHRRVVTYGSSMGGYGALLAAAFFPVHKVITFHPQVSLNQVNVSDRRWTIEQSELTFWFDELAYRVSPETEVSVIYDRWLELDRRHVDFLRQQRPIDEIHIGLSGHGTMEVLHQTGLLTPLIEGLIAGEADRTDFKKKFRAARKWSPYLYSMVSELLTSDGRREWAAIYNRRGKKIAERLALRAKVQSRTSLPVNEAPERPTDTSC